MVERHTAGKGVEVGLLNSPGLQAFCATARCLLAMTVLLELNQVGELELPFLPSAKSLLYFTCQNQSNSVVVVVFN